MALCTLQPLRRNRLVKTHSFLAFIFMRIKIGFICQISYERRKSAVSVGMLREYCVLLPLESDKRGAASDISARRSGGLSSDRFFISVTSMCWTPMKGREGEQRRKRERESEISEER